MDNKYRINNNIFILRKFNDGSLNLNDDLILSLNDISLIIKEEPLKRLFLLNQPLNFNDKLFDDKNSNLHFELYKALLHKDLKVKTSHIYSNLSDNSGMWSA
ncbi:hypothetical protein [Acinetobacter baumannii]|uniref:hypothetical protein n=1 Tax=Acinetobacter baumannii TaxID=470 RepID=UPI001D177C06|nr:hypothetical protein [Acinetobacter baumannii]